MADIIKLVQGDTKPSIVATLVDSKNNDAVINIVGATVRLKFKAVDGDSVLDTLVGIVLDGANGLCKFEWNPTTLDVEEGLYQGEIEITFQDGTVQTVYDLVIFQVRAEF